tara:strand:+ start:874 stop:1881 length:1008 start_codon:yes stop_codon:yes gene_type:complete
MPKNRAINLKNTRKDKASNSKSWKNAFMASPGPKSILEYWYLFLKGICMGTADIVPGVSGGTIAFITGIYNPLLSAISSINSKIFLKIYRLNFKEALSEFHFRFLFTLFLGITIAIITTANLMNYLINEYPIQIWSFFFGLISASIFFILQSIKNILTILPIVLLGTTISFVISGLIPLNTAEGSFFIFFCGMIAICAMILPGLSGAFILLIFGKYEFITSALKNPLIIENLKIILIFCSGCIIGIIFFSKLIRYSMLRWHDYTLAILTGFMIGSMRKVWPWKITLETQIIRGKEYVLREENIWPSVDQEIVISFVIMFFGFFLVFILEKFTKSE